VVSSKAAATTIRIVIMRVMMRVMMQIFGRERGSW
jgi:hypothetical protein